MATNILSPVAKTEVSSEDGLGPPLRSGGPNVLPTDLLAFKIAKSVVSCLSVTRCSLLAYILKRRSWANQLQTRTAEVVSNEKSYCKHCNIDRNKHQVPPAPDWYSQVQVFA